MIDSDQHGTPRPPAADLSFEAYLALRPRFAVSRQLAVDTVAWAEPLARQALGAYARRDGQELGEGLPLIARLTTPEDNGGWGELMPVWFKPYERPLPIFILNNWAMTALMLQAWMGDCGPAFGVENLLRILIGSSVLIPFMPATQRGGHFLRHGALTVLLGLLWLPTADRDAWLIGLRAGGRRFAEAYQLQARSDLSEFVGQMEQTAFLIAEGNRIGGDEAVRGFLTRHEAAASYAALFGGLCFSVAALHAWYGPRWDEWVFQAINVHYRYATFAVDAWARWLAAGATAPETEPA